MDQKTTSKLDKIVSRQSLIANFIVNSGIFVLHKIFPKTESNILYYELFTSFLLTYLVDIIFIQRTFNFQDKLIVIPYDDYKFRLKYLFKINVFYKYLVVIGIGFIITKAVVQYINKLLKRYKLLQTEKHRYFKDTVITFVANVFVSSILLNFIKFKWAYVDSNDVYLSATILSLFGLSLLISVSI